MLTTLLKLRKKKTIVFTNGCFDLFHYGHLSLLLRAKKLGDILVVGINSDASIKRLKGPHRPIVPLSARKKIISALKPVDFVFSYHEDTPIRLLKMIKPHILVKGSDWKNNVVGSEFVESYGGQVKVLSLKNGISTTALIQNILKRYTIKK